jgi:hypothetical protein
MSMSTLLHRGRLLPILSVFACLVCLGGCEGGGGGTAAFPKVEKKSIVTEQPKTPAKGMDRTGSDGVQAK